MQGRRLSDAGEKANPFGRGRQTDESGWSKAWLQGETPRQGGGQGESFPNWEVRSGSGDGDSGGPYGAAFCTRCRRRGV